MIDLSLALYGAAMNRWRGHASKYKRYFPRPFPQIALAIPYAYVTPMSLDHPFVVAGVVLVLTTLAWLTGHGKFMDLGTWNPAAEDERLEFTIKWLEKSVSPYWYDAIGLAVTGIAVSLPAGIATGNPLLAVSGALKAPAYMIGWKVSPKNATAIGETLTGLFLLGSLAILT